MSAAPSSGITTLKPLFELCQFPVFPLVVLVIGLNAGPAPAHDWYTGLTTPTGQSCCHQGDCQPVGHRYTPGRGHEIEIEGSWVRVDPKTILPTASPDGLTHACFSRYWWVDPPSKVYLSVRCVILGGIS
jgi:hypothetical protein